MKPFRQFLMPRARGLAGPFFHPWALGSQLIHGTGNFLASVGAKLLWGGTAPYCCLDFSQATLEPQSGNPNGVTATFTRASTATVVDYQGNIVTVPANVPRFQGARWDGSQWHATTPEGAQISGIAYLNEPAATNQALNSGDATLWVQRGSGTATLSTETIAGLPAYKLDGFTGVFDRLDFANSGVSNASTGVFAASFFVKGDARNKVRCTIRNLTDVGNTGVAIDLATGAYSASETNSTITAVRLVKVQNGQRVEIEGATLQPASSMRVGVGADTDNPTDFVLCTGGQLTDLGNASSYIPTTTAAVTRSADGLTYSIIPTPNQIILDKEVTDNWDGVMSNGLHKRATVFAPPLDQIELSQFLERAWSCPLPPVLVVSGMPGVTALVGDTTPVQRTFTVDATATNGTQLPWTIAESTAWLAVSPASGTGPTTITATIDPTGLAAGAYTGDITVAAPGAQGSPKTLTANLTVYSVPVIDVSVASLSFNAVEGSNPDNQTFLVTDGSVFSGAPFTFAVADDAAWLETSVLGAEVTVSVRSAGLVAGQYNATVTITSPEASNSPQTIPVTFDVLAKASIGVTPTSLVFSSSIGVVPASQMIALTNEGDVPMNWTVSDNAGWLTVAPASGTDDATLTVSCGALPAEGSYNATITVSAPGATNTPQTIAVSYSVVAVPLEPWRTIFGGEALPDGWTFVQNQIPNATLALDDGAVITIPAGTSSDSISSTSSPDQTAGLVTAVSGDFDVCFRFSNSINGDYSSMVNILLRGDSDARMIRFVIYGAPASVNKYGYARYDGVGNNFQAPTGLSSSLYLNGHPHWMRCNRAGTTYTFYGSTDGLNWETLANVTSSVDALTFKIGVGQYADKIGVPIRIDEFVDIDMLGGTDARQAAPSPTQGTTETSDLTTLPTWLSLVSSGGGTATHSAGKITLTTVASDSARAKVTYNGAGYANAGLYCSAQIAVQDTNGWFVVALALDDGGGEIDVYANSPAYINEAKVLSSLYPRPLTIRRPVAQSDFNEPYTFLGPTITPTAGSVFHYRLEKYGSRFRMRHWKDSDPEPTTWNVYDGEVDTLRGEGPIKPFFAIGHNPGLTSSSSVDILDVEFYELT